MRAPFPIATRLFTFVAGFFVLTVAVLAEPQEIASSLTLDAVVVEALRRNPQIRAMQAKWEAAQERPAQERTLPNPMFQYSGMDATDGGSFPNTNEKRFMVQQQFPWFGKQGLRGKVADKDVEIVHGDHQAMELEVVMSVKETYFDLYAVQHALSITRVEEDVLKRIETVANTRYATGQTSQQDVLKAQTEVTMLKQQLLDLQQQETTLKAKLNLLMDRPANAPLGLAVTMPSASIDADADELLALAEKARPEIRNARAEIERNQYERNLMKKEFLPDYRLGVEYRNFDDQSKPDMVNQVMFIVSFDLPIWQTKYRAAVRSAEKMIDFSQAALEAAVRQTSYDVQDAYFKLVTARRSVELYKTALIPQAEARFSASEAGYRTGSVDFLDLLESERFLLNARLMAAMAEGNLGMQFARLERAVGTGLTKPEDRK